MEKVKNQAKKWLCVSIILMLLSMVVTSGIQTSGWSTDIKKLAIETQDGYTMSALLFVPKNATKDTPAPAVVMSHGSLNNKEMMDMTYVELARRGFVVLAVDQPNHGDSEITIPANTTGVYNGVLTLSKLPYVDPSRIGVSGHSMGGSSCRKAITKDLAEGTNLIAAAYLNSFGPDYVDADGKYSNMYGTLDVAVLAGQYDEFYFTTTGANGETLLAPYYMQSANAQSFLHFGKDPAGLEVREAGVLYKEAIDGEDVIRAIYNPAICHPWAHFSTKAAYGLVEFFDASLGSPNYIAPNNQTWNIKEVFNFLGAIGFAMFLSSFAVCMVFTPYFGDLRAAEPANPIVLDKKGKLLGLGTMAIGAVFSSLIFVPSLMYGFSKNVSSKQAMGLGLWSTFCGIFTLIVLFLFYKFYGKKQGFDLVDRGVKLPIKKLGKTILLAFIVAGVGYSWVFFADYFFVTDFRLWTFAINAFDAKILGYAVRYVALFLVFYVISSVASNCFNFTNIGGKHEWVNNLIVSLFVAAPAMVLPAIQYSSYVMNHQMVWPTTYEGLAIVWLFPLIVILFGATYLSRFIYKATKNPYIAGIVNGIIISVMPLANTWMYFDYKA